jgi:hypothetical protein
MSALTGNLPKIGNEITVRISLTFQEAPDIHTLLAMTPVRERGKLVRLALERYIAETAHPAGDVEQQINAISNWLRARGSIEDGKAPFCIQATPKSTTLDVVARSPSTGFAQEPPPGSESAGGMTDLPNSSSINRWLDG